MESHPEKTTEKNYLKFKADKMLMTSWIVRASSSRGNGSKYKG